MLPSDRLASWLVDPDDLLSDARVRHYWDEGRVLGRWYEDNVTRLGEPEDERVEWDAYFLYRPGVVWDDSPPEEVSWGRTIVDSRDRLERDFTALLADAELPGGR